MKDKSLGSEPWNTGACSCLEFGCDRCCYAFFLPCCAAATARSGYDDSDFCFTCLCMPVPVTRSVIREGYNIKVGRHMG